MVRNTMMLPKVMGDETTDTRDALEKLGFIITNDTYSDSYEVLAPEGWTIEWKGRDGAVFNEKHEAVVWLWRKTDFWQPIFTMRLHP